MNTKFEYILKIVLIFLVLLFSEKTKAERYALLAGVSDYMDKSIPTLQGPKNDIESIKKILLKNYYFKEKNIITLINGEATKKNILDNLKRLDDASKAGDFLFFYFSGHGTSPYDPSFNLNISPTTGAIVPYDLITADKNFSEKLIIGQKDLKPIFLEMERKDKKIFVIIDACFSGNTVRSTKHKGIPRYLYLPDTVFTSSYEGIKTEQYPYKKVMYISASSEYEMAYDLPEPVYDDKRHGTFTAALLFGLEGQADRDNDKSISYRELYAYAKNFCNIKSGQTPKLLFPENTILDQETIFNLRMNERIDIPRPVFDLQRPLRFKIEGIENYKDFEKIEGINLVFEGEYDILLTKENNSYNFYLFNFEILCKTDSLKSAIEQVKRLSKVQSLLQMKNSNQKFNVWLKTGLKESRTIFFEGDKVDFAFQVEKKTAYIALLNIDSHGYVTVLLPSKKYKEFKIETDQENALLGHGVVSAPFGAEYFKVFAFSGNPLELIEFANLEIDPSSKEFDNFISTLKNVLNKYDWAENTVFISTHKRH